MNVIIPLVEKVIESRFKPWIKREQKNLLHLKDRAYNLWKRNKTSVISRISTPKISKKKHR
jgi:hypothetical protein